MTYVNKLIKALIAESLRLHDALLWDVTINIYEVGRRNELIRYYTATSANTAYESGMSALLRNSSIRMSAIT